MLGKLINNKTTNPNRLFVLIKYIINLWALINFKKQKIL